MTDVCILTGAGSGIGRAVALRLAEKGVRLVLVGRRASNERTLASIGKADAGAELFELDLEDYADGFARLAERVERIGARRLGVVLAASRVDEPSAKTPLERLRDHESVYRTNVVGNLAVLQACLPGMLAARFGRVVFFAGGGAAYAFPLFPAYGLSKVSTVRMVENLAAEHPAQTGLSFVCLAPGAVDTPMLEKVLKAGGTVRTRTSINEAVGFIEAYLGSTSNALTGRYVHVRDAWAPFLEGTAVPEGNRFLLRRIE
jgi:NAD(P)-dependent dehydrogenase (short-subunit alcohol dehydrogenase family)